MKRQEVIKQEVVNNPYPGLKKGKGIKVAELLLSHKPDVIIARERLSGKGPGYAFADAGVETRCTKSRHVHELVGQLLSVSSE